MTEETKSTAPWEGAPEGNQEKPAEAKPSEDPAKAKGKADQASRSEPKYDPGIHCRVTVDKDGPKTVRVRLAGGYEETFERGVPKIAPRKAYRALRENPRLKVE